MLGSTTPCFVMLTNTLNMLTNSRRLMRLAETLSKGGPNRAKFEANTGANQP